MKKRVLLFTAIAGLGYVALSSYSGGPAASGRNCVGVKGSSVVSCNTGGCHGSGTTTGDSIRVDSAGGVAVSSYVPGMTYTVTVTGWSTNTAINKFGFQFATASGSGSSQVQAGSFNTFPASVTTHTTSVTPGITFVEQNATITGTSSTFTKSFNWVAPAAGAGSVTMYLTVNAVDGNGNENSADISKNAQKVLTEQASHAAVAEIANGINLLAYPNPVSDLLNVQFKDMLSGTYTLSLYDMTGRVLSTKQVEVSGASYTASVNTAGLAKGIYQAVVEGNGNRKVMSVVK